MRKKKFDIFRTFEVFNSEAISIIRERIIKFILVEADNIFSSKSVKDSVMSGISAEFKTDGSIQMTVLNNPKVYSLLTNTWRKYEQRTQNENINC